MTAQYSFQGDDQTQGSLSGGFDRTLDGTTLNAGGLLYSRFGTARADVVHNLNGGTTQYSLTFQSGAAATGDAVALGGRDLEESALIAAVDGDTVASAFDVLIDGQFRGHVRAGDSLPIFLRPYRSYEIRLRSREGIAAWYDSAPKKITLYPGNVQRISWRVESVLPVFGQAVLRDGRPLANALVRSRHGIGETDENGYFQIEAGQNDALAFTSDDKLACEVRLGALHAKEYESIGKVTCQ